ncbi:MAG: hypothetical protein RIS85_932, partial [Pseudomonadota bacterium]
GRLPPQMAAAPAQRIGLSPRNKAHGLRAQALRTTALSLAAPPLPAPASPDGFSLQARGSPLLVVRAVTGDEPLSFAAAPATSMGVVIPVKDDPRWSFDNWLLLRTGGGAAAQAPGQAAYGGSQTGAVVRFRLGKGDVAEPFVYLRSSLAINAPGKDREVALGFGARPFPRVPLRILAEARLQDTSTGPARVRPVATVITELPWQALPLGFRAEIYGQAGYAGGRSRTPFFDAQAVADRPLVGILPPSADLRVGAGMWAGGQKDAVRLDLGPRVSMRVDLGDQAPTRLALDWRLRMAGNARPGSGPALTLASSF